MNKTAILNILRTSGTVFSFKDILLVSGETRPDLLRRRIHYYIKNRELYYLRRGIYARDKNYNRFELATRIYTPSYVSFESVLAKEGVIFQHYGQIFIASYLTREIVCDDQVYSFRKIKDTVLVDAAGIDNKEFYSIASKERAFLDMLYLYTDYHFDNLSGINWEKCFEMLPAYNNKAMAKRLNSYYRLYKHAES